MRALWVPTYSIAEIELNDQGQVTPETAAEITLGLQSDFPDL